MAKKILFGRGTKWQFSVLSFVPFPPPPLIFQHGGRQGCLSSVLNLPGSVIIPTRRKTGHDQMHQLRG